MISYNLETSVLLRDGITESLRHEETLEGLSSYFLLKAGTINQNHKLRLGCSVLIQLGLENFQSWRLYNLSGQPVPMGGYLHNSFFFFFSFLVLIATRNLSFFQLQATTSCSPAMDHCEGPASMSLLSSQEAPGVDVRNSHGHLFCRLNKPILCTVQGLQMEINSCWKSLCW